MVLRLPVAVVSVKVPVAAAASAVSPVKETPPAAMALAMVPAVVDSAVQAEAAAGLLVTVPAVVGSAAQAEAAAGLLATVLVAVDSAVRAGVGADLLVMVPAAVDSAVEAETAVDLPGKVLAAVGLAVLQKSPQQPLRRKISPAAVLAVLAPQRIHPGAVVLSVTGPVGLPGVVDLAIPPVPALLNLLPRRISQKQRKPLKLAQQEQDNLLHPLNVRQRSRARESPRRHPRQRQPLPKPIQQEHRPAVPNVRPLLVPGTAGMGRRLHLRP